MSDVRRSIVVAMVAWLSVFTAMRTSRAASGADTPIQYNRDVRPILSDACFRCHGFDANKRKAKLRLDLRDEALQAHKGGVPIAPGHPERSEVYRRITSANPDDRMPPTDAHVGVTAQQADVIRRWIEQGAVYQPHWSLIPVQAQLPPKVEAGWARNEIDAFVLSRLQSEGLHPSPEADRPTLIRRASLDLTGVPPTPEETAAFLHDDRPDAYERVVDRLLASPRFGERMAMQWLDAARYADTNGYNNDEDRTMWRWRDWVIDAFNSDLPYDRFLTEQLAGDLIPSATLEQKVATGFNRNHVITTEGGIIDEEYRLEYVFDRVHTTATVFLGLSMRCARCHYHKYDPISQKEYYQFAAYFNNLPETGYGTGNANTASVSSPSIKAPTRTQEAALASLVARRQALEQTIHEREAKAADAEPAWEQQLLADPARLSALPIGLLSHFPLDERSGNDVHDDADATHRAVVRGNAKWSDGRQPGAKSLELDGGSHVDAGQAFAPERSESWTISAWINPRGTGAAAILSKMDDDAAYRGFDFILEQENRLATHIIHQFAGSAIKVVSAQPVPAGSWHHVAVTYDGSSKAAGVKFYIDGKLQQSKVEHDSLNDTIKTTQPLRIGQRSHSLAFAGRVSDVRIDSTALPEQDVAALAAGHPPAGGASLFKVPVAQRTPAQQEQVRRVYLQTVDPQYRQLTADLAASAAEASRIELAEPATMVMQEMPATRPTHVLHRGDYDKPGDLVTAGVPACLPAFPAGAPPNRLGLAQWMVDRSNPLVTRVAVNRLWELLFGTGIVETSEDFGVQGELPSHPELLDWLAAELPRRHWSMKQTLRLIALSATYRQSSDATPDLLQRDPHNRLLARGPRFRMPAEMVRDNALAVSGLLSERLGGPSVKPYQPQGLWEEVSVDHRAKYASDHGSDLYRRSMYTFWKRTCPPPAPTALDAPDRETCVVRRPRTNTPLQALVLMNDPTYVEAARKLAERMIVEGGKTPESRLTRGYLLALSRPPQQPELAILLPMCDKALSRFHADPDAARKLLSVGEAPRAAGLDDGELAAWTTIASTILDLDETITKE